MIKQAKQRYHCSQFEGCNSKQLFQKVNKLCTPENSKVLPSDDSDSLLAERFSAFFADKISNIKTVLNNNTKTDVFVSIVDSCNSSFSSFAPVSEDCQRYYNEISIHFM